MLEMGERYVLQVYVGSLSRLYEALSIEASKTTTADEIVDCIADKLSLKETPVSYELAEVMLDSDGGQDCKERRLAGHEFPVALQLLWPKKGAPVPSDGNVVHSHTTTTTTTGASTQDYKFCLRRKMQTTSWSWSWTDTNDKLIRDYFLRFLYQPRDREYPDLCQLPDLTEQTLLENLKVCLQYLYPHLTDTY
jgi:myosin-9